MSRIKPVWVELGLQTIHPETAKYIRRGYDLSETRNTTEKARKIIGIEGEFSYEKEWDRRKLRVGCRAGTVG